MKSAKKIKPKPGRPSKFGDDRQIVGSRLPADLYQRLAAASVANRTSISAEIERRLGKSLEAEANDPNDVLQTLGREIMAAFEGGGRRSSRTETKQGDELPTREWMENPGCYTEAASRAVEVLADWHPRPTYGWCLRIIYALRARLDRAWHDLLLLDMTLDEAQAEKKKAIEIIETMSPTPSLLDPLFFPAAAKEKDEG